MMPLESSVKGSLFFKDEDGEYSEIKGVSEISETSEAIESFEKFSNAAEEVGIAMSDFAKSLGKCTFEFEFECEIKYLKRKRFVKLLMCNGYQRNEANQIARRVWFKNGHYTYFDLLILGL